jgi:hypothetical protein
MSRFVDSIKDAAFRGEQLYLKVCVVDAVHESKRMIDCSPVDDTAQLIGVLLQSETESNSGLVLFPAVGSAVLVGFLDKNNAVVLLCSDIYKTVLDVDTDIVINGGNHDGIVNINKLTDKINALVDVFNNHTHVIASGTIQTVGSASAQSNAAPVTVPVTTAKAKKFNKSDYEDDKIKH